MSYETYPARNFLTVRSYSHTRVPRVIAPQVALGASSACGSVRPLARTSGGASKCRAGRDPISRQPLLGTTGIIHGVVSVRSARPIGQHAVEERERELRSQCPSLARTGKSGRGLQGEPVTRR